MARQRVLASGTPAQNSVDFLTDSRMISTYAVPPNAIVMVLNGGKDEGTYLNNSVHSF